MDWAILAPEHPLGWVVLAGVGFGLSWWAWQSAMVVWFGTFGAEALARERNWLFRHGERDIGYFGDNTNPEEADWDRSPPPGTVFELLGDIEGFVFHARQWRYRPQNIGFLTVRNRWKYHYVVALATTPQPYDGRFTSHRGAAVNDLRKALYPAFLTWEKQTKNQPPPPHGFLAGHGLLSMKRPCQRLTKRRLLADLDLLVSKVRPTAGRG
ncbi:hypothetical protein [Saccharomonospora xinjiangensis]|uniref:Uncharacterized protein n=1 Tax=Saccharomonospora xinjiangensis XJ-54 TaxID=882086 RepID=I0V167_9PSEU|nr:hypothetical protein [Saccharomonospora xinjiangensis]EID53870.1 hypothetical protein SacxiDRAFT_1623 [Saccharomonospora xinjiangensis XJ-54]